MRDKQQNSGQTPAGRPALRERAEQQALSLEPIAMAAQTPEAIQRVLHELRVHQIELELQNEELRTARDQLEAGRARYFDLYDLAPVGYCSLSEQGLILEANLTTANLLGVARGALLKRPFSRFIFKEDQDIYYLQRKRLFASTEPQECDLRLVKADGTLLWAHLTEIAAQAEDGAPTGRMVLSDISARKRAEAALRESNQRLTSVLDSMDAAVYIADMETYELLFINSYGRRNWGASPGQKCWSVFQKDQDGPCSFCTNEKLLDKDRNPTGVHIWEFQNTVNGKWFDCRDLAIPWTDERIVRMEIATDITLRKQAEAQLLVMTTELEALVNARTQQLRTLSAQLTMTEERERRQLAQDLHDALGQTLAVLRIKLSALSAASAQSAFDEVALLVGRAEHEARSAIQSLSPPILRTLGLNAALEWLVEEMKDRLGLTIYLNCAAQQHVLKDEIQAVLYRATRELLINVAKHAKVGQASISCLCDDHDLTIMVSDDGCGFDPAAHFNSPGHGSFGLTSVRERLCNLGGEMEIDSSPGRGTTVRLTLPLAVAEAGRAP